MDSELFLKTIVDELDLSKSKFKIYYDAKEVIIKHSIFYDLTLKYDNEKNIYLIVNDYFGALGKLFFKKNAKQKESIKLELYKILKKKNIHLSEVHLV